MILLSRASLQPRRTTARAVAASAVTDGCCAESSRTRDPPMELLVRSRWSGVTDHTAARAVAAAVVQGERLPDALGHEAGHLASGDGPHHRRQQPTSSARSPGSGTSAPTSARRCSAMRSSGSISARTGSASIPTPTTTRRVAAVQEVVDGYPGLRRDVQTYLKERIREVLTGAGETIVVRIYGDDLEILRSKAEEVKELDWHRSRVWSTSRSSCKTTYRRSRSRSTSTRRAARDQAGRRSPSGVHSGRRARGWRHLPQRQGIRRQRLERARRRATASPTSAPCSIDTPDGGHVTVGDIARVSVEPTPNMIVRENASREHRHRDERQRSRPRLRRERHRRATANDRIPPRVSRRGARRIRRTPRRRPAAAAVRHQSRRSASSSCWSSRSAAGGWPSCRSSPFRWRSSAACSPPIFGGGVISLGSLVGLFTILGIVARNGIMQISHFQHLEREEGEPFGVGLVLRGSSERLTPDPDDRSHHRTRSRATASSPATSRDKRSNTRWHRSSSADSSRPRCSTCSSYHRSISASPSGRRARTAIQARPGQKMGSLDSEVHPEPRRPPGTTRARPRRARDEHLPGSYPATPPATATNARYNRALVLNESWPAMLRLVTRDMCRRRRRLTRRALRQVPYGRTRDRADRRPRPVQIRSRSCCYRASGTGCASGGTRTLTRSTGGSSGESPPSTAKPTTSRRRRQPE